MKQQLKRKNWFYLIDDDSRSKKVETTNTKYIN